MRATHKVTKAEVAIKIVNKELLAESKSIQVKEEAQSMMLCQHPNIIKLSEVYETSDTICIVTEFQFGGDL